MDAQTIMTVTGALGVREIIAWVLRRRHEHRQLDIQEGDLAQREAAGIWRDAASLREEYRQEIGELRAEVAVLRAEVATLRAENAALRRGVCVRVPACERWEPAPAPAAVQGNGGVL